MKNGLFPKVNPINAQSTIHFTPSNSNKISHYFNFIFNSKDDNNNSSSITKKTTIYNYSSSKYKSKMQNKNKLITKNYNIVTNVNSINDKKILFKNFLKKPIISEPTCGLDKFLPPKISKKHKTLVIDLDETLIHSYFDVYPNKKPDISFEIALDNKNIQVYTLVRPGAIEFLKKMSEYFEIVIFTASVSKYATPIINFIDKEKNCEFKLFREHCSMLNNGFTKDLKKLSRDLNNLILLDNNPNCFYLNKENGFPIKTWIDDFYDKELFKIMPYLTFLANENIKDVRPILTKIRKGNEISYVKFDKIIKKYKNKYLKKDENNKHIQISDNEKLDNKELHIKNNERNLNEKINYQSHSVDNNSEIKKEKDENDKNIKDEINENNLENKILNIDDKMIKTSFKNKIKTSKENRFYISKNKNDNENNSENLNSNLFNKRNRLDTINTSKFNLINTPTKYTCRGIFYNNNDIKNILSIKNDEKEKMPQIKLKPISSRYMNPIVNPNNYSSRLADFSKNNEDNKQNNTIFNDYKNKKFNLHLFNDLLPSIKKDKKILDTSKHNNNYLNNLYSDYYKTINTINNHKNNIQFISKERIEINNSKNNELSLSKINMNRSNSENREVLINTFKKINNKNLINLEENTYKTDKKDFIYMKLNRSLSSVKRAKNLANIQNYSSRCFSSNQKIFKKTNNMIHDSKDELHCLYKIKNLRKEVKNILLINKSNYINNSDLHPMTDNDSKLNKNNYETKASFQRNKNAHWIKGFL